MHQLVRSQIVAASLADVFDFFRNPFNLEAITPPWLGFRILSSSDPTVKVGSRIRYRLRLHGIPLTWESRIAEYRENEMFADEQIRGPYRHWYHRHLFRVAEAGVEIKDVVDYALPFGLLGRAVHHALVRRQLDAIFDFRAGIIATRFRAETASPTPLR